MPDSRTVLPAPKLLNLTSVRAEESAITLCAQTSTSAAQCPTCGKRSARVHSRCMRTLADLPWQGVPLSVHLCVRRFFCDEAACQRAIFAERLPGVVRITRYLKEQEGLGEPLPDTSPGISASHAAGILVKRPKNRSEEELRTLRRLKSVHQLTEQCCTMFEEFAELLTDKEQRSEEQARSRMKKWTEQAKVSGVPELKAFAVKLLQNIEAVVAGMILPYGQGQTEGRVNKLKLIKRSMYGRRKFDLLRPRVLYASAA
jgi:transposase